MFTFDFRNEYPLSLAGQYWIAVMSTALCCPKPPVYVCALFAWNLVGSRAKTHLISLSEDFGKSFKFAVQYIQLVHAFYFIYIFYLVMA